MKAIIWEPTVHTDLTLEFQIAFVGSDNDRESVLVFDSENLLMKGIDFFEGITRSDGINEQESLAGAHVLLTHSPSQKKCICIVDGGGKNAPIFLLPCSVEDVEESDFFINNALLAI